MGSNEALTVAILNSRWVSIFALASTINVHFGSSNSVADLITFPRAALLSLQHANLTVYTKKLKEAEETREHKGRT